MSYKSRLIGSLCLLLASFIWGMGFVAQKLGMEHMGPFYMNGIRNILATLLMLPFVIFIHKRQRKTGAAPANKKRYMMAGLVCGVCLFIASNFQQVGLKYTTAGNGGFITAMYILLVPIIGLFLGKRIRLIIVVSLAIAVTGLYFLCVKDGFSSINKGDVLIFFCAIAFAVHIIAIDTIGEGVDSVTLSCMQFGVNAVLTMIVAFFVETITLRSLWLAMPALLYLAICSSGIAYTLQIVGQKRLTPVVASLIMSFESVFSVVGGVLIMHDVMSAREIIGCVLVFLAVILSQLPERTKKDAG